MPDTSSFINFEQLEMENCAPVCINLLPGEKFISFDSLNYGCRFALTNFRIIIIFDVVKDKESASDIISIPLGLIYHLEQYAFVCLNIVTKIGRKFSVTFPNIELCEETIGKIKSSRAMKPFGVEFCKVLQSDIPTHFLLNSIEGDKRLDHEYSMICDEFKRLRFDSDGWRISEVNKDSKLCSTYPQYHIVPKTISDEVIMEMAKFRSKYRFISVTHRSTETGTFMLRSGQPLTGMSCWRSKADEKYFKLINDLHKKSDNGGEEPSIKIFDARSYTCAQLNRVKGGGMEFPEYYCNAPVEFLNIPNMHTMRTSFESLAKSLAECDSDNFYDLLAKSNWLQLIRQLLKSAISISDTMYTKKKSVLIHCSDGWDRTPQLTSLCQIIMDPFYRTIEGFKTLIYREWILFGHRFNERCALWPFDYSLEYSPIFLQWLDCVYQLLHQFPDYFYFNETFLIKLALHVYSGLFGTFNSSLCKSFESCSVWSYLCQKEIHSFINPLYSPQTTFKRMKPQIQMLNIKLWTKLYFDSLIPNYQESQHGDKYNGEIPSEINKISLLDSIFISEESMDDYNGEEAKYEPSLLTDIGNELNGPVLPVDNGEIFAKNNNYFNAVNLKWSLDSLDHSSTDDHKVHFELDLDGLFKQNDFIERFSDSNRRCRHLYKSKIEFYRKKLEYLQKVHCNDVSSKENNDSDIEGIDAVSSSSGDVVSCDSQFSILEEVVRWVPDHAVTSCHCCNIVFGLLTRKHHCRSCGKIFCFTCSRNKAEVPKQKLNWKVRVCDECYSDLQLNENADSKSNFSFSIFNLFS